ncbi:hypothetical protein JTE90_008551 [Oedothorax gibbosus]|uniref:sn-1-specific diacylglycerol lipase ABHD11 n=1 Tax=Oedothorax gibbosus TaxID=931172 RepID=A0AAV6TLR0_9ARAC|nr:hypothetical protein JTE90_008551 [Oedothorax gibbosus]KAG8172819.1 hypothetical protein JTE90_008551 [Oedothorax gibbosus]
MKRYTPVPMAFVCVQPETKCKEEPPLIFLHGITGSRLRWKNISQEVANATERKVYVVDARNHGDTEWCDDDFDFDTYANDLLHFMDFIGAPKATLVGHSMGGKIAIRTALTAPERVDKLVIEDMFVKKTTKSMLDAVVRYIEWTKEAVELIPLDADESTAQKIIEDYLYDKSPGENVIFMIS